MKTLYSRYKWMRLVEGIIFLVVGILTITISCFNTGAVSAAVSIAVASVFFIVGGVALVATLVEDKRSLFTPALGVSALLIAIGVILCIRTQLLGEIIVYFMAAFAIAFGVVEIVKGIQLAKYRAKWWMFVSCFVLATVALGFGIYALLVSPGSILIMIYILLGCCLIAFGVTEIAFGIKYLR